MDSLCGGVSIAAGSALLVVQLQQASLTGGPGDHQNERDDSNKDVSVDVFRGGAFLKRCFYILDWGWFPFVAI